MTRIPLLLLLFCFMFGNSQTKTKAQLLARFETFRTSSDVQFKKDRIRASAHDGEAYWWLLYGESMILTFQATGDFFYLDEALAHWYAYQDNAVVNNTFPNASKPTAPHAYNSNPWGYNPPDIENSVSGGIYNDTFLDWDNHGARVSGWFQGDTDGGTFPLYQGHGMRSMARLLLIMKNNPSIRSTANGAWPGTTYQTQYDDILAFWQQNMWNKWWTRGPSNTIMRTHTHMASHWTSVGFFLNKITPNANQALGVTAFNTDVSLLAPALSGSMRGNLRVETIGSKANSYVWPGPFGNTTGSNDIPHAGAEMRFISDQLMFPDSYWTATDKQRFLNTAHAMIDREIANPTGPWPFNINSGSTTTSNYWQLYYYGWPAWGRFDETLQTKYTNSKLYNETSAGRMNNAMIMTANLLYNRAYLDGTLVFPEFVEGSVAVTGINWSNTTQTIRDGETANLAYTFTPANPTNTNVTIVSGNPAIVSNTGQWVSTGSTTLTITAQDGGFTSIMNITAATTPTTGATVTPSSFTLTTGGTVQLTGNVLPATATTKTGTWGSNATGVATVNSTGLVTAISNGTATITFTTTDGSFTDTSTITVAASAGGPILDTSPIVYYRPETIDPAVTTDNTAISTWEDASGNGLNATVAGGMKLRTTTGREVEFDGTSWMDVPDDSRLNFNMGTDNFTIIVREGDVVGTTSGYLVGKVKTGPFTPQYGIAYGGGVLNGVYGGGILTGFTNAPSGSNRLIIAVYTGTTVNVWIDGVQVLANGTVGTGMATGQSVNIGGRTDGSYLANAGSRMDLLAIVGRAITVPERDAITTAFKINTIIPPAFKAKRIKSGANSSNSYYLGGVKKKFNN